MDEFKLPAYEPGYALKCLEASLEAATSNSTGQAGFQIEYNGQRVFVLVRTSDSYIKGE